MFYCRTLLRYSRSTIPLRTAVEFARVTGGLHDDKCSEGAAALMTFSSSLSPCIPFAEQGEREFTRNEKQLHSSVWHDEQLETVNVNTPLFTCADPLQHDDRLHSVHKRVNNTCLSQEERKNVTTRGLLFLYNDTDATLWERHVEMYQEEIYNEVHRSSNAEIAASPEMTNQIVIEGVVNSVCAGYRTHHGIETETSANVNNKIMESKDSSSIRKKSSLSSSSSSSSSTQALTEAGAVRKVVTVLNPHRVNALLVQVWLYCNDNESANSTIAPLAVCSYVTLDALNAMYGSDKETNQRAHNESRKSSELSGKAEMTTKQSRNDTKNVTCSKEEVAFMVHELIAELEEMLLFQSVVVRGSLKMEMFFDGDVNRVVQVPIVWLPDNAIKSGFYLLPITQKRAQYVQQLKKIE